MTVGYVEADWLAQLDPSPVFEGVILPERWNGFARWATTRPVIERLDALHRAHPDAEHLPRFTFVGDVLIYHAPGMGPEWIEPFEVDPDRDHLWDVSLGMVWTAFADFERRPGAAYRAYRMDGSIEDLVVGLTGEG